MKSIKVSFDDKLTFNNLLEAHYRAVKGKRNKLETLLFEQKLETNIANILYNLQNNIYRLGKYREFTIYEPKERVIKSLPYKDRIVHQWYIYEFIKPFYLKRFIKNTYACIETRGTHLCVKDTQQMMRKMHNKYNNYYIIKCDIKKYFYNIDKDLLFKILKKRMKDNKLINLTRILIYDDDNKKGIPIGNYTSQYFANIYLNELDQYIKNTLKLKYYLRYMDDFVIMLETKEECKKVINIVSVFLKDKLKLELNHKSRYYPSKFGINFCGYIIHEHYILLRDRSKNKIKYRINNNSFNYRDFYGHIKHSNCFNFFNKIYFSRIT